MLNGPPKMTHESAEDAEFYDLLDSVISDPRKRRGSLASKLKLRRRAESLANMGGNKVSTQITDYSKSAR